ncbi:hypothetical protein [Paenirhodobacter sp. CAU 1674]|uniref:hypothetical protein n=1 Tax=Paenirhodobacter sp. CAU 1674 TaxID=3032596 RepID=UPI0023DC5958|nr:hypothetical protein [Paenirhodobacter sp. CAU 1674]MDF2141255.1 hypothetical protein [Paenirhodobacter sp. CAU 1674]
MEFEELDARLREIELTLLAHRSLIAVLLAESAVSSNEMRATLEDIFAQAIEARKIHIPQELGEQMPDVYRIIRVLLEHVNKQLSVPLKPRPFPEEP